MVQKAVSFLIIVCLALTINAEEETEDATSYMDGNGKYTVT